MSAPPDTGGTHLPDHSHRNPRNQVLANRVLLFLMVIQVLLVASRWGDWPVVAVLGALFVFRSGALALLSSPRLQGMDPVTNLRTVYVTNLLVTTTECHLLEWSPVAWMHLLFQAACMNGYSVWEGLSDLERRLMLGAFLAVSAGLALHTGLPAKTIGLYCFGACFFYASGEARGMQVYAALRDTQESHARLVRMQAELVAKEKLSSLGLLAAGVAHEINNPMSFVSSNVWSLHRDLAAQPQLPEALREYVDDVLPATLDGIRRVNSIVADLRRFARNDSEAPVEFDLNEEVRTALRLSQGELKDRALVEVTLGEVPPITGQPRQLGQVLLNLIVNAAQALPERGGVVKVSTRAEADEVIIQVKDNGVGMSKEALGHLFQPFFTTKPVGQGTGLGLAVAYGIIIQHKGRIDVDSAPGQGTCITIWLPSPQPEPEPLRATG